MGVWIRSQDKKRSVEANAIEFVEHNTYEGVKSYSINTWHDNCLAFGLGLYSTEERALQVLDAIENHIYETERMKLFPQDGFVNPVFEMPTE